MKTIDAIQAGFKQEAEKVAAANSEAAAEKKPEVKDPPTDKKEQDNKPKEEKPAATNGVVEKSIAQQLKDKHGLEFSDEEILDILKKPKQSEEKPKPGSVVPVAPKIEDVSDDDVAAILEKSGRSKDLLTKSKELKSKSDDEVVRQHYIDTLTTEHGISPEEATALYTERFFIPPDGDDAMYTEDEKKVGKALLKKEADQIRGQVDYVLDGVRNAAYSERMAAYNTNAFKSTVESFMAKAPKNFVIPVGKSGAKDLGEFPFEVNDEVQARVAKTMQNPASFAERFKNEDGAFDMDRFYNFLVHLESQDNIYKSMANFYHSKGLDEVEDTLHNNPDLTNVGRESADKRNKTAAEQKKEAEEFNKKQVEKNLDRHRRTN
jgi:hypothetical protein